MKFAAFIKPMGNNTGILVPPEIRDGLGGGRNPLVKVTLAGHAWQSKVATMGGDLLIGVSAEIRRITGVKGGETHEVTIELDDKPRTVEAPHDLKAALGANPAAQAAWDKLAPSHKKAHVTAIEGAKAPETRARRVQKALKILLS
jgi:hypothetical protein